MTERIEVAVVGSGPGGAVAACRLAEAGREVLVLEEGAPPPLGPDFAFSPEELETLYRHGGATVLLGRCPVAYAEGRAAGGGSEINSALYHRAPPGTFARWAERAGPSGLTEAALAPHAEAVERELGVTAREGPPTPAGKRLAAGASRLGFEAVPARRMAASGAGGERRSMSKTFLPRLAAAGGRLRCGARVDSLARESGRWVLRLAGGGRVEAGTVFLAGGALQTPALLRRSGLAPLAGRTLALHPTVKAVALFDDVVFDPAEPVAAEQVKPADRPWSLGCSVGTPAHLAVALAGRPETAELHRLWPRLAVYYAMTPSRGVGRVWTPPLLRDPVPSYRVSDSDLAALADGLAALAEILFAAGARRVWPTVAGLGPWTAPPGPLSLDPRAVSLMTVHLMASAPLGEDAARCPVDPFGRVRGADGLRVCDASLFGGPLGANPQGLVMALSRHVAASFLEGR